MKDVKPTPEGESAKVKVKVRINLHGILSISSASLVEKLPATESDASEEQSQPEPMEATPQADGVNGMETEPISAEVKLGSKRKASGLTSDILSDPQKLFSWFYTSVCLLEIVWSSACFGNSSWTFYQTAMAERVL